MYEIKGKTPEGDNKFYLVENAADIEQAVQLGHEAGLDEIYAAYLSKIKECFTAEASGITPCDRYFCATAIVIYPSEKEGGKPKKQRYKMLFEADSLVQATEVSEKQLMQGYDMESVSIAETSFDGII